MLRPEVLSPPNRARQTLPAGGSDAGAVQNFLNERVVFEPSYCRRLGEIVFARKGRIGISLNGNDLSGGGETHIDPAEPLNLQDSIYLAREPRKLFFESRGQFTSRTVLNAPLLSIRVIPFGL